MFISEETYKCAVEVARSKHKPWLPSLESQVENLFNHTPGILFLDYKMKEFGGLDDFQVIDFYLAFTKLGMLNYVELFNRLRNNPNLPSVTSCIIVVRNAELPECLSESGQNVTTVRQGCLIHYGTQQEYVDKKYDYLHQLKRELIQFNEEIKRVHI